MKMLTVTRTMMKLRTRRMKQTDLQKTPSMRRCLFSVSKLSGLCRTEYLKMNFIYSYDGHYFLTLWARRHGHYRYGHNNIVTGKQGRAVRLFTLITSGGWGGPAAGKLADGSSPSLP